MSQNNRARRAAKAKARAKARARAAHEQQSRGDDRSFDPYVGPQPTEAEVAVNLWHLAALEQRHPDGFHSSLDRLVSLTPRVVLRAAEGLLLEHLDLLWANGWQPMELLRQGRIATPTAATARLVAAAIASDHAERRATTLDAAWIDQVEALALPADSGAAGWIARWAAGEGLDHRDRVRAVLDTWIALTSLPPLVPLMPMPGLPGGRPRPVPQAAAGGAVDPVLERVRNLLAKAESTTFEAEATSLTAKAQELIARHAIDTALLEGRRPTSPPVEIRMPVDAPYADVKSLLLQTVAETGRCRSVFAPSVQISTVLGYRDDLAAVEMLFTSLLVQAQHALNEAARNAPPGARTRRSSYRSAFLLAFTQRIGDRLRQVNDEVVSEVERERGESVLPVLTDRSTALDAHVAERFGELESGTVRGGYDGAGWAGGRMAADAAQLGFGEISDEAAFG